MIRYPAARATRATRATPATRATHALRHLGVAALALSLAASLGACSGSASSQPPGGATATTGAPASASAGPTQGAGAGGGSAAKGYDCPTLLTPAELDAASGLTGGTVVTNGRGDQPGPGEVAGVTECGIDIPSVSLWSGSFAVATGPDAMANFDAAWDIAKGAGATTLAGVGTDALIQATADRRVNAFARGANGVGVQIGVAWDEESTTEAAVEAAVKSILTTVLPRT